MLQAFTVSFHPSENYEQALDRASNLFGIAPEYWDIWGNRHVAANEVRASMLRSLGVNTDSQQTIDEAVENHLFQQWSPILASTIVVSAVTGSIPLNLQDKHIGAIVEAEFWYEDGQTIHFNAPVAALAEAGTACLRAQTFQRRILPVPQGAPYGYHRLQIYLRSGEETIDRASTRLILCPDRAYEPSRLAGGQRTAGVAASVYGLRSERNWGCGDFTDLEKLSDWVAEDLGGSFISLNPLHSIPNRQPYNTSPYLPNCSFYRNPIYLDVERVEDFTKCPIAQRLFATDRIQNELAELRGSKYVEYARVARLKMRFMKLLFREFRKEIAAMTPRAAEFKRYMETEGYLLDRFALYCALDEAIHRENRNIWIWPDWPAPYRDPQSPETIEFAKQHWRAILFFKYVQWQLDVQLAAAHHYAKQKGLSIGLYHDLALATDRCGSDLWAHGDFYMKGCRVGSPPDGFSPKGQDWAFPPPNSLKHKEDGYNLFAQSIRKNLRHGGALRIDHVMRFFRLFWIPDGKEATEGTYVKDYSEDLLHILALESVRNQVVIVGEDLGTVEPEIRETLQKFGVLSYRLLYFERTESGDFKMPHEYPPNSLVSVSTHDLPTLTGFWTNRDIEARRMAGLLDDASYHSQIASRTREKQQLLDIFFRLRLVPDWYPRSAADIPEFTGELHYAAIGFLVSTPASMMVINQEDLTKDPDQQNLPGSTAEYPNWRHKMIFTLDELRTVQQARDCTAMVRGWLERSGRLLPESAAAPSTS